MDTFFITVRKHVNMHRNVLPIYCKVATQNKVQVCKNCRHFYKKSFALGCDLKIWQTIFKSSNFFYNPNTLYYDEPFLSSFHFEMLANAIACRDYDGNEWVLTSASYNADADTFPLMNGSSVSVNRRLIYELEIQEIDVMCSETLSINLVFGEEDNNNVIRWLNNLVS